MQKKSVTKKLFEARSFIYSSILFLNVRLLKENFKNCIHMYWPEQPPNKEVAFFFSFMQGHMVQNEQGEQNILYKCMIIKIALKSALIW